ncbi:MAG: NAD-dependent epimerase/dehydratase family protein [Chloroflexi bacterium]|nr:NAD-dependent epimerase/dehydratase family protein [Chloroflexota bacterium]
MDVYRAFGAVNEGRETDPLPLDETSPVRTERYPYRGKIPGMDDYEKLDVEAVYLRRQGTVLRLPMVYGEHDVQRREEPILRRVRAGRARIPVGPGTWLWSRGYVKDIATAVRLAIETPAAAGEVLNLCEAQTWTMDAWLRQILAAAGSSTDLTRVPEDLLPRDLGLTGSIRQQILVVPAKARALLGWTHGDPEDRVRRSVAWHLAHPPSEPESDFSADDRALAAAITDAG